jgi:phosphoglycerate kinase
MNFLRGLDTLSGKRVMVRVDCNAPLDMSDDARLVASLPTIRFLRDRGARIILVTHLGRPNGKSVPDLRVEPVSARLSKLLGHPITQLGQYIGNEVSSSVHAMKDGDIVMLENIRFSPDEKKNTGTLATDLAALCDLFVLDGFAVAHRAAASVVGVAAHVPAFAGLLLEKEIKGLSHVMKSPEHPFVFLIGGAKIETKLPVIQYFVGKADKVLLGGSVVNAILSSKGYGVGESLGKGHLDASAIEQLNNHTIVLPVDLVVGTADGAHSRVVEVGEKAHDICESGESIFDIGPKTAQMFCDQISSAHTLVLNGAMGYFEQPPYDRGTAQIIRAAAHAALSEPYVVAGGGHTVQSINAQGLADEFDLVSTGGGAMLEYLAGKKLPGIVALG